jgi:CRP-like cAMP-binding protein
VDNPRATDDELFSASRTAKNRLAFLTENDWVLITDKSTRVNFTKDDRLIREGQTLKTLYVLIKGTATVSILGKRLAHIGPGEVCGEMAFLENSFASATVIADNEVAAYAVDWKTLADLFEIPAPCLALLPILGGESIAQTSPTDRFQVGNGEAQAQ